MAEQWVEPAFSVIPNILVHRGARTGRLQWPRVEGAVTFSNLGKDF